MCENEYVPTPEPNSDYIRALVDGMEQASERLSRAAPLPEEAITMREHLAMLSGAATALSFMATVLSPENGAAEQDARRMFFTSGKETSAFIQNTGKAVFCIKAAKLGL